MFLFFAFLTVLYDFSIFKIESIFFLCHLMIWIAQKRILQRCFHFIAARFEGYISQSTSNNPSNYWYCMLKKPVKTSFVILTPNHLATLFTIGYIVPLVNAFFISCF